MILPNLWVLTRTEPLLALSTGAALASVTLTSIAAFRSWRSRRAKLKAAEEQRFVKVLESDDIAELGSYLDDVLGDFSISEYADDEAVRRRVDSYLKRIQNFVGTVDEFAHKESISPPIPSASAASESTEASSSGAVEEAGRIGVPVAEGNDEIGESNATGTPEDSPLSAAYRELKEGEVWNALAKMRRVVELRLREIAQTAGVAHPRGQTAGMLLQALTKDRIIDSDVASALRFSIYIANRAIHGDPVALPDAEIAILEADDALSVLPNPGPALTPSPTAE